MLEHVNPLFVVGLVLLVGMVGGLLANRLHLPMVTGQLLAGVLLGPAALGVFADGTGHLLRPVTHFALGLMGVTVGHHLHVRRLRNTFKRLTVLLLLEVTIVPLCVFGGMLLLLPSAPWYVDLLLATIAVATAPATIVAVVKETRSEGIFVKTLVAAVALNNIACIALFETAHTAVRAWLAPQGQHAMVDVLVVPLQQLAVCLGIGGGAGLMLLAVTRRVVRSDRLATASMLAILLTAGLADAVGASALLACMFLGMVLANLAGEREGVGHVVFENFETAILAVFFTLAGIELKFEHILPAGGMAAVMVVTRFIGKNLAARWAMGAAKATERVRRYLGYALIPQAGVAIALILVVYEEPLLAPVRDLFLAVGITAVTINEIIGPILARMALVRAGEAGKDHPRVIDFLHEENIVTDFHADSYREAIEKLADLLIKTNRVSMGRDAIVASVLQRDREVSSCVGQGLAMPHVRLDSGERLRGVMALNRDGLPFNTPDGVPLHCILLLGTPPSQKDRHLEVLAAFARCIGADRYIQRQLYHAYSPAHAYEILHADEAEDFNYFLETAAEPAATGPTPAAQRTPLREDSA